MISTKTFHASGFYIFESKASGNSNYIENLSEAKDLLTYLNYYLKDYLKVQDYFINRHGFQIAVKLKSEIQIRQAHHKDCKRKEDVGIEIWRIISNRIRLFLSSYVRRINFKRGRSGVLVRESYKKYYFEKLSEALSHLSKMKNQSIKLHQRKKKYRGLKKHYKISHDVGKGSILLCSKDSQFRFRKGQKSQSIHAFTSLVVEKWIKNTISLQNTALHLKNSLPTSKKPPDL